MKRFPKKLFRIKSLRTYITAVITGSITIAMLISAFTFYDQTSKTLEASYRQQMEQQLNSTMEKVNEQINLIDYLYSLYMSNTMIYNAVEFSAGGYENRTSVEKQMAYLLINNYLWKEQFVKSVYIFTEQGDTFQVSTQYSHLNEERNRMLYDTTDHSQTRLSLRTLDGDESSLYFIRNIFSSNTGKQIATMIISVDREVWIPYLSSAIDRDWFIYFFNDTYPCISTAAAESTARQIAAQHTDAGFTDSLAADYLSLSRKLDTLELYSAVVAPKDQLQAYVASALRSYLLILVTIILAVLLLSFMVSRAIVRPITKMIGHIDRIAAGHYEENIPSTQVYEEFQAFTDAVNHMLLEINTYHADQLEKQMLLKNAEIQRLQSQINPHFLFNTLNALAWKAQMADNEELYQMTISLGELLKSNVISKEKTFNTINDELRYIKFYVYLQRMRFEDKIQVEFEAEESLGLALVPCFSIQTLVENAFVHGLEPKRGNGRLVLSIRRVDSLMRISVIDDGVGFHPIPDLRREASGPQAQNPRETTDKHPHVGLRNLDKRLYLLYGEAFGLQIESEPNTRTSVSFTIPIVMSDVQEAAR